MKCPDCESTEFLELSHGSTMMGSQFGCDYGRHDPNYHTRVFGCENGHVFGIYYRVKCLCGWPKEEK